MVVARRAVRSGPYLGGPYLGMATFGAKALPASEPALEYGLRVPLSTSRHMVQQDAPG